VQADQPTQRAIALKPQVAAPEGTSRILQNRAIPFEERGCDFAGDYLGGRRSFLRDANLSACSASWTANSYFRTLQRILPGRPFTEEVVDEVIVQALSDGERPEKLALEPWLYRLASSHG